jgi:hypothetical protein
MRDLEISGAADTPHVLCSANGEMILKGRSLPENPASFYEPILIWASDYELDSILLTFKMEYLNTASSKQIFELLRRFIQNTKVKKLNIHWYYEEGDSDSFDTGMHFSTELKTPFEFFEVPEF